MIRLPRLVVPRTLPSWLVATLVAVGVALAVIGLRASGKLQRTELGLYDVFVRLWAQGRAGTQDPRIVLVTMTERDIQEQGTWPVADGALARALEMLIALGPRAIGLDIYRDVPVPPGTDELDRVLRREPRIVAVTKFAEGAALAVGAPKVLRGTDRVGFNDVVVDPGGTVRRVLLFLDDGQTSMPSFGLQLALLHLAPDGIRLAPDPADQALVRLGRTTVTPLEASDGPYVDLDPRGYQFLADFRSGGRPFARITLGALLRGEVPVAEVRGRVVLVGVTAESVKDDFYTPLAARRGVKLHIPGVELHAHFVSQILRIARDDEAPLRSPRWWLQWLWLGVVCGVGASLVVGTLRPWRLLATAVLGLAVIVGVAYAAFVLRWWWPLVPPVLGWFGVSALLVSYNAYRQGADRSMLMKLFSQHVSKEVAEEIWREREQFIDGDRPRPTRAVVTALLTDLAGFTTVSERIPPEALMDWLNEYMAAMAPEISRHGGVIRQYAGDSIVAIFGVPVPRRDDAEVRADAVSAVQCALAMERRLRDLNREWMAQGRPPTGMRIGIMTGPAVAGTLGSAERWEYVVVGDTVNTASRLESFDKEMHAPDPFARPCRILVGASTHAYVADRFETEWLAEAHLKGKQQLVAIYRVLGERAAEERREWMEPVERAQRQ